MPDIIKGLGSNWHISRVLQSLFAIAMLISFLESHDSVAAFGALFFGYQAIFNVGCCGGSSCNSNTGEKDNKVNEIEFEEIKSE